MVSSPILVLSVNVIKSNCPDCPNLCFGLSECEGIFAIGKSFLMGFKAIRNRFKTEFPIAAMCFVKPASGKKNHSFE